MLEIPATVHECIEYASVASGPIRRRSRLRVQYPDGVSPPRLRRSVPYSILVRAGVGWLGELEGERDEQRITCGADDAQRNIWTTTFAV